MASKRRIGIVGGGPGGLMLARILHERGMPSVVFERDAHALDRPQGGTLDLHEGSGLSAIDAAGLRSEFLKRARYDDQGDRLVDHKGRVHFEYEEDGSGDRPEIDRSALRSLLLDSLPEGCVRWNSVVRGVEATEQQWRVVADGQETEAFDLVVGADGLWSCVRPQLSSYQPQYSGLTFIEFGIDDIDRSHSALARLVGRGKVGIHGPGREIIAQRNGHSHVRGYAIFRVPADWAQHRFNLASSAEVRQALLSEFADFAPEITDLFRAAGERFVARQIFALPVGHHWAHRRGLTLIGDAAHVMSPFGGEGVNAALFDAERLATALSTHSDPSTAVASFEAEMFERVEEAARESADAAATVLSHDSLGTTLAMYERRLMQMRAAHVCAGAGN